MSYRYDHQNLAIELTDGTRLFGSAKGCDGTTGSRATLASASPSGTPVETARSNDWNVITSLGYSF